MNNNNNNGEQPLKCNWKDNKVLGKQCSGGQWEMRYSASGRVIPICEGHVKSLKAISPFSGAVYNEAGLRVSFETGHKEETF